MPSFFCLVAVSVSETAVVGAFCADHGARHTLSLHPPCHGLSLATTSPPPSSQPGIPRKTMPCGLTAAWAVQPSLSGGVWTWRLPNPPFLLHTAADLCRAQIPLTPCIHMHGILTVPHLLAPSPRSRATPSLSVRPAPVYYKEHAECMPSDPPPLSALPPRPRPVLRVCVHLGSASPLPLLTCCRHGRRPAGTCRRRSPAARSPANPHVRDKTM